MSFSAEGGGYSFRTLHRRHARGLYFGPKTIFIPSPLLKMIFLPPYRVLSFLDSYHGLLTLILPYFAFILSFYFPLSLFLSFFPAFILSFYFPLSLFLSFFPFSFPFHPFSFIFSLHRRLFSNIQTPAACFKGSVAPDITEVKSGISRYIFFVGSFSNLFSGSIF